MGDEVRERRKRLPSGKPEKGLVASRVRRHINKIGANAMFVTRDVLHCGRRGAVDSVLFRLVQSGDLIRLARGVFISSRAGSALPSLIEIVKAKASAFNRAIFAHAANAAAHLGLIFSGYNERLFASDGSNSSFLVHAYGTRVEFRNVCPRKRDDVDSEVIRAIRGIWLACQPAGRIDEKTRRLVIRKLGREKWDQLLTKFQILPAWIWNCVQQEAQFALQRSRINQLALQPRVVRETEPSYGWLSVLSEKEKRVIQLGR